VPPRSPWPVHLPVPAPAGAGTGKVSPRRRIGALPSPSPATRLPLPALGRREDARGAGSLTTQPLRARGPWAATGPQPRGQILFFAMAGPVGKYSAGAGGGTAVPPADAPSSLSGASGPGGGVELAEYSAAHGAARLATGDTKGALAEAAGGLAAPVASAARQLAGLAADVRRAAAALSPRRGSAESAATTAGPNGLPRRRRSPAAAAHSAA
jgi:hypothetical protein